MENKLGNLVSALNRNNYKDGAEHIVDLIRDSPIGPILINSIQISDGLKYHIEHNIPLTNPIYRKFSEEYFALLKEAKALFESGSLIVCADSEWMLNGNIGEFADYFGTLVPLDMPMAINSEESILKNAAEYKGKNVNIGKPRTLRKGEPGYGRKQYVVYVMNNGNVKRITFGDPNLKAKPERAKNRKSFRARHKCDQKKDKTTPGYWACRYPPNW
jgi:hypothetical protein